MKNPHTITTGATGEALAVSYLQKRGYRILETNFRCRAGEIDIIAEEKGDLVFVEVKTRTSGNLGYPEQAVGIKKQRKMSRLVLHYLQTKSLGDVNVRFDVVAVLLADSHADIQLFQNAFEFADTR